MTKPSFKRNLYLYLTEHLVITSRVEAITCILSKIKEKQWHSLLTEEVLDLLIMHPDCTSLQELITNNAFTEAQYTLLIQYPYPRLIVTELQAYKALSHLADDHEFPLIDFIVCKGLSCIDVKLLVPDDIKRILAKEQPLSIFRALVLLTRMLDLYNKKAGASDILIVQVQECIRALIMHHDAPFITAVLEQVEKTELAISGNLPLLLSKIIAYPEPDVLFKGLYQLRRVQLLSNSHAQDNFNGLIEHAQLRTVVNLFEFLLSKSYLLPDTQRIFSLVLAHPCPEMVGLVCKALDRKDALSIARFELILQSTEPQKIAAPILVSLYPEQLCMNGDEAIVLVEPRSSVAFDAHFLWVCAGAGILTRANIASIRACSKAEELCYLISLLYDLNVLDDEMAQTNFNA